MERPIQYLLNNKNKYGKEEIFAIIILMLSVSFVFLHLYSGLFGHPAAYFYRSIHVTLVLILCFLYKPLRRESWFSKFSIWTLIDIILILLTIYVQTYYFQDPKGFQLRQVFPQTGDTITGFILWVLILEGTRRTLGLPMVIIAVTFTMQALFSDRLFSIFYGARTTMQAMTLDMYMSEGGIFGMAIGTIAAFVVLFLIFGSLLQETGTGKTFIDLALSIFGAKIGGPAKAAVVGSCFFGMLSGSSVANVTTTGTFTIPLMKKVGYRPIVAGAVEATASTGGMFTPPIMGATAFIVAAFLGKPYIYIATAAAVPALLFYVSLFASVDFLARKEKISPLSKKLMPVTKDVLKNGWHLLIPIVVLVYLLISGYTASMACFWSIVFLFTISFLKKTTFLSPIGIIRVCQNATKACLATSMACACAGIIVSATTISGLGLRIGTQMIEISGGHLWLALILSAVLAVILGMGLTTTAVYIIMVVTVIPAMVSMGVEPLAAHLFALFWGVLSNIIPPVAIASFAAAGIAGTPPMKTAVQAFFISIPAFLVFAAFVYNPTLLLVVEGFTVIEIVVNVIGCIIGVVSAAAALHGHAWGKINAPLRVALGCVALISLNKHFLLSLTALFIGLAILLFNRHRYKAESELPPKDDFVEEDNKVKEWLDKEQTLAKEQALASEDIQPDSSVSSTKKRLLIQWGMIILFLGALYVLEQLQLISHNYWLFTVLLLLISLILVIQVFRFKRSEDYDEDIEKSKK